MPEEQTFRIIGEIQYKDDIYRFMHVVLQNQVAPLISENALHPSSVEDALKNYRRPMLLKYYELWEELMPQLGAFDENKKWTGVTPPEILKRVDDFIDSDESYMRPQIEAQIALINELSERVIDFKDTKQVQIVLSRDMSKEIHDASAFLYLVVYPPQKGKAQRVREISYLRADCHTVDAMALQTVKSKHADELEILDDQSREINLGEKKYQVRKFVINPITDKELLKVLETKGRTLADRVIQKGLGAWDRLLHRTGQHIDPVSAFTSLSYAVKYALATHRGVGTVDNDRILLPPL